MGWVTNCYVRCFTILKRTFLPFHRTLVVSVVINSDEKLNDRMLSEDFGAIQNEGDSLAQQCFVEADEEEFVKIGN